MFHTKLTPEMSHFLKMLDRVALNNAIRTLTLERKLEAAFCLITEHRENVDPETLEVYYTWCDLVSGTTEPTSPN